MGVKAAVYRPLILAFALAGCGTGGGGGEVAAQNAPKKPDDPKVETSVVGKTVELMARTDDQLPTWTVKAQNATLNMFTDANVTSVLKDVKGDLFDKGKVASSYQAENAFANRSTKNLQLKGNVMVTNPDKTVTLHCNALDWRPDLELIQARGDVRLIGNGYQSGSFQLVWLSPDLNRAGTPDLIKKDINMKQLLASLALGSAITQQTISFKSDEIQVLGMTSWRADRQADGEDVTFTGAGNPFSLELLKQGGKLTGRNVTGRLVRFEKTYRLGTADITGNAVAKFDKQGIQQTLTSERFSYVASSVTAAKITAPSAFTFTQVSKGTIGFKGSQAVVNLVRNPQGAFALESATIPSAFTFEQVVNSTNLEGSGTGANYTIKGDLGEISIKSNLKIVRTANESGSAVRIGLNGNSGRAETKVSTGELNEAHVNGNVKFTYYAKNAKGTITDINGSASSIEFYPNQRMILKGGVKVGGSANALIGDMSAETVTLRFNSQGELVGVEAGTGTARLGGNP